MKIAIGLEEENYDSKVDKRFGRAGYFIILDDERNQTHISF